MNLEQKLKDRIIYECDKWIKKHHKYHNQLHRDCERNKDRISNTPDKTIKTPDYWKEDKKFNPFYVRSNASAIAKSIANKIKNKNYEPNSPYKKKIPKSGGGERELTVYQIPDAAVSGYFYSRLLEKNKHRFSSFSYAYRNDRNIHFAIQDIDVELKQNSRTFIAEFDFSDFFGSIVHNFLFDQFNENGFLVSEEEQVVIKSFLNSRVKGIPQGTSLSLFLANLVCWKLDKSLEKNGLRFARYADDTVIWSQSYASICEAFNIINQFSREANVPINAKKSDGINLLTKEGSANEISSKNHFEFLGYSIGCDKISIKEKTIKRIKKQVSYLLYRNLIQPLKFYPFCAMQIPANDQDKALLISISQIRRYLYGGILHREIWDYINGRRKTIYFKGIMSFYPLLTDEEQLKDLDGWMVSVIHRSIKKRSDLLLSHGFDRTYSFPFNVKKHKILETYKKKRIKRKRLLQIPSFQLIYKAIERGILEVGIERVMHPESSKYQY